MLHKARLLAILFLALATGIFAQPGSGRADPPIVIDGKFQDWVGKPTLTLGSNSGADSLTLSWFNDFTGHALYAMVASPIDIPADKPVGFYLRIDTDFDGDFRGPADRTVHFTCAPAAGNVGYGVLRSDGSAVSNAQGLPNAAGSGRACEYRIPYDALGVTSGERLRMQVGSASFQNGEWVTTVSAELSWERVPTLGVALTVLLLAAVAALAVHRLRQGGYAP